MKGERKKDKRFKKGNSNKKTNNQRTKVFSAAQLNSTIWWCVKTKIDRSAARSRFNPSARWGYTSASSHSRGRWRTRKCFSSWLERTPGRGGEWVENSEAFPRTRKTNREKQSIEAGQARQITVRTNETMPLLRKLYHLRLDYFRSIRSPIRQSLYYLVQYER